MPAPWSDDADVSDNDDRDDLSSLDLDASASDDREHFMPPSERLENREEAEYQRFEDFMDYHNMKQFSRSDDGDTDDELFPNHQNKKKFIAKYHSMVFPGLKIPVNAHKKGKKISQDVTWAKKEEVVPIMSVECPLPGGEAVTVVTDPVQKVSWGPLTRIEASKEARDVVKEWQKTSSTRREKVATNPNKDRKSPLKDKDRTILPPAVHDDDKNREDVVARGGSTSASQVETESTISRVRVLKPPPPTPPDAIFHGALSMPTLPNLHRISDAMLVEQYRLQRALDPDAFDKQTRLIKRGLVDAKVARGGKDRLLKNEFTVELASREDAATAEKWATGRIVQMRSRGNTLSTPSANIAEKLGIRGGEVEDPSNSGKVIQSTESKVDLLDRMQTEEPKPEDESQENCKEASDETTKNSGEGLRTKISCGATSGGRKAASQDLKAKFDSLDLPSHVSKMTTSGTIRHQHSEKREVSDYGERRTVTTWIQIEEVYDVPAANSLSWKDVMTAVKQEADDTEGGLKGTKKGLRHKKSQGGNRSQSAVPRKQRKQRKTKDESSDSEAEARSSNKSTTRSTDHDQTRTEELFDTLSRYGEVNEETIRILMRSLSQVMSELRGRGELTVEED